MAMSDDEKAIEQEAIAYAKKHRASIARRITDPDVCPPEASPVSVFMAGSPGAGKTEASIELLANYPSSPIIRIDPDELRTELPGYSGGNAWLFQKAVISIVEAIHDRALQQKQSFIMDGTLSSYDVALKNIERSVKRKRLVQILYVYQSPEQAWRFVQAREAAEGRRIEPETFVRQYFAAREVVNKLKWELGVQVRVDLLMKNNDGTHRFYKAGIDQIDNHIPEKYSPADVRHLVGLT